MRQRRGLHGLTSTILSATLATFASAIFVSGTASATAIGPGFDAYTVDFWVADLTADGLGMVSFRGASIGPTPYGPDFAHMVVRRFDGIDPFNTCPAPPCSGTIDIEIVALNLKSSDPVEVAPSIFVDIYLTIDKGDVLAQVPQPNLLNPSIGQMNITHDISDGGRFTSCFGQTTGPGVCPSLGVPGGGLWANAIIVPVGGNPNYPDYSFPASAVALSAALGIWEHDGRGTDDFRVRALLDQEFPFLLRPVPEPSTIALIGLGLAFALRRGLGKRPA